MQELARRPLGLLLALVLVVGVGAAIFVSASDRISGSTVAVKGAIGSEKQPFFDDARVLAAFHRLGLDVQVDTAGSRQIASTVDLSKYDFAFPAGVPAAEKIRVDHKVTNVYDAFFTPMAIATWKPIVGLLEQAGVAHKATGYEAIDVAKLIDLAQKDTRWTDLPGNTAYPVNKSVLLTSTDVRTSNSAAMYLSLASYVANGNAIVQSDADIDRVMPIVSPLFLKQGFVENSSEVPFENYLVQGMGKAPLVMIYESQFLARAAANDGSITDQMVLAYPEPTVYSKHILLPLTDAGRRVGEALTTDAQLRQLEIEYGFRNSDTAGFRAFSTAHNLNVPNSLVSVIDPPSYDFLERMINRIEDLYKGGVTP